MSRSAHVPPSSGNGGRVISRLQDQMLQDKKNLEERLERGEINAEEFANQVNGLLNSVLKQASQVLTPEEFENTFGFQYSGQKAVLIEPKLAAASAKD